MGGIVIQGRFDGSGPVSAGTAGQSMPQTPHRPAPPPVRFGPRTPGVAAAAAAPAASGAGVMQRHAGGSPPGPSRGTIQRSGAGQALQVDSAVLRKQGPGQPLPGGLRARMEAALGADFSAVRIHTGHQAASIGAVAFTAGNDLYFAPGRYQPETAHGQQLLGHELAHVVQQRQGRVRNPFGSGVAIVQDRQLEAEADRLGQRAAGLLQPKPNPAPAAVAADRHRRSRAIQPKIKILGNNYMGAYQGEYTSANMVTLLNGIGTVMTNHYEGIKVKRGPLPFIREKGTYTVNNIAEIVTYMTADAPPPLPMLMDITYGADHGDYHFTGHVTKKKAQWTLEKAAAQTLMETAIRRHLPTLLGGTPETGWQGWYIGQFERGNIGDTVSGPTNQFTIQLQVSREFNAISYHGYPDQRLLREGVAKTKSALGGE